MKVLIAGQLEHTKNYETILQNCGADCSVSLHPDSLDSFDRLLLPGGGDIHPAFYNWTNHGSRKIDPRLDYTQFALLKHFVKRDCPILGICRGMQLINVFFGGDLIQDLPDHTDHHYIGKDQYHPTRTVPGTILHSIYGEYTIVNSAHHQACRLPGTDLLVTQTAHDGIIEGIEHTKRPILGVQWHPERMSPSPAYPGSADGILLFHYFLSL
jgi:putative glutamine amidotransferase